MRRLIINADDFGLTSGVNRAIIEAHQRKIVTSATLMAKGAAFEEAVELAKYAPDLSVGCHLVLIGGSPVLPASEILGLCADQRGSEACFRQGWASFAAAALSGRLVAKEIEAEATAQIRRLQAAGVPVSHVDSHKHVHIFPQVLQPVLRAAAACGVRAVRNPFEPLSAGLLSQKFGLWRRWLGVGMLHAFAGSFRRMVRDAGMVTPDGIFGVVATGALDARLLHHAIEHLPEGTWELLCHPGYDDAQLRGMQTRLWESRQKELQILTSPEIPGLLAGQGIQLTSYRALVQP